MGKPGPLDIVNVVDVECTCWDEANPKPSGEVQEIIQIGIAVVRLDPEGDPKLLGKESVLVKPEVSTVSPFCEKLTGLKQSGLDMVGVSYFNAVAWLKAAHQPKDRLWVSWGDFDRKAFERQSYNVPEPHRGARAGPGPYAEYPFGPRHLNLKTLYALLRGKTEECGLSDALTELGLGFEGKHHDAGDDAWNTARILCLLVHRLRKHSVLDALELPRG